MKKLSISFLVVAFFVGLTFNTQSTFAQQSNNQSFQAESKAQSYLAKKGIGADRLQSKDIISDETGNHVRFSQSIDGIRVYGGDVITHEKNNGKFDRTTGELFAGDVPAKFPSFGNSEAVNFARQDFWDATDAISELVYYPQGSELLLAYMVDVKNTDEVTDNPRREMIVINAMTGEIIDRWDNLQTAGTTGTGYGFYAGQVTGFPIDLTSGTYSMFDVPSNGKTYDFGNKTCSPVGCRSNGTIFSSPDSIFGATGSLSDRASVGVDAHYFAQKTLQYFSGTFLRNGIDNANNKNLKYGYMVSRTHYGSNYNNAYWDGSSMTYGDGDGTTYRPFDALDVVGHEMTHGVTERTSNLQYSNESGAANESFSDIFGVTIEFKTGTLTGSGGVSYPSDWWIGEDLYYSNNPSSPTKGIRNMANTHSEGDPDHYSERYTGTSDNGGVHTNSGIQNFAFYMLAQNAGIVTTHHLGGTATGIGLDAAAAIAYDADTKYCTATDTYAKVAGAWVSAAKNRYGAGSVQATQTSNAWKACGVTPTVTP
ncbi:MAG: peptidase M4 family protein [Acidobacteria bacterium]|nr:peptidase M4 family protein [Acidobacteriota bacterium]